MFQEPDHASSFLLDLFQLLPILLEVHIKFQVQPHQRVRWGVTASSACWLSCTRAQWGLTDPGAHCNPCLVFSRTLIQPVASTMMHGACYAWLVEFSCSSFRIMSYLLVQFSGTPKSIHTETSPFILSASPFCITHTATSLYQLPPKLSTLT